MAYGLESSYLISRPKFPEVLAKGHSAKWLLYTSVSSPVKQGYYSICLIVVIKVEQCPEQNKYTRKSSLAGPSMVRKCSSCSRKCIISRQDDYSWGWQNERGWASFLGNRVFNCVILNLDCKLGSTKVLKQIQFYGQRLNFTSLGWDTGTGI